METNRFKVEEMGEGGIRRDIRGSDTGDAVTVLR